MNRTVEWRAYRIYSFVTMNCSQMNYFDRTIQQLVVSGLSYPIIRTVGNVISTFRDTSVRKTHVE